MKNYLIESMASYMDKMEKSMSQRKRLNESKKVLSERFSNIVPDENDLSNYLSNELANNVAVGTIETRRGRGYTTFIVHLVPEQYDNNGYGYSFDFVPKEHKYVDSFYDYILQTLNRFITEDKDESLTEARNPENDEVNAIIRKWANSDRNRLSKKDQKTLDKYGISLKDEDSVTKQHAPKEIKKYYSGKRMVGSNPQIRMGLTKNTVKSKHDDFDYANYLNKERKTDSETHRENIFKNAENHAKKKNESLTEDMNTTIVTNIVDWLADHETAWEDCCNYFGVDPDSEELYNVDKDELLDWVSEHKQLSSDLLRHWGAEWAIKKYS